MAMKDKLILVYYVVSIFLLANGAFATSIFLKLHMPFWRQLIWLIGILIVFVKLRNYKSKILLEFLNEHKICFLWTVFLTFLTLLLHNFNVLRLVYAWWLYFSGLPFVLFPFVLRKCNYSYRVLSYLFIFLGLFMSIGLILDYSSGGFFTKIYILSQAQELAGMIDTGRYCFLSEAPTTFGVYLCFCMALSLYQFSISQKNIEKLFTFSSSILFLIGAWFTGSRQIVFTLLIVFISVIGYLLIVKKINVKFILITLIILSFSSSLVMNKLFQNDAYQHRFSEETITEDSRSKFWHEGFMYCIGEFDLKRILFGEAVALAQTQKALKGEKQGYNYENTFWFRMSETGLSGLYLLLLPIIYWYKFHQKNQIMDYVIGQLLIAFLIISYISPNGQHQTSQMVIYIAVGIIIEKKYRILKIR